MGSNWQKRETSAHYPPPDPDDINLRENPAFNTPAKIAYIVFFFCICGFGIAIVTMLIRDDHKGWLAGLATILGGTLLIFGPIIAAIIWATHRHLKKGQGSKVLKS
jgi:hypothetical protein